MLSIGLVNGSHVRRFLRIAAPAIAILLAHLPCLGQSRPGKSALTNGEKPGGTLVNLEMLPPLGPLAPDAEAAPPKPISNKVVLLHAVGMESRNYPKTLLFSSPAAGIGAVVYNGNFGSLHKTRELSKVERIDVFRGQVLNVCPLATVVQGFDLDSTGTLLAALELNADAVDIWQIDGTVPKKVSSLLPFGRGTSRLARQPNWVRFIGDKHVLIGNGTGELGLWQFRTGTNVWFRRFEEGAKAACSANKKYLAVLDDECIVVLDTATGRPLGRLDGRRSAYTGSLSFNAEGTRLAACGRDELWVCDLTSGKPIDHISEAHIGSDEIDWLGDDYLLTHGLVVDVKRHQYILRLEEGLGTRAVFCGQRFHVALTEWNALSGQWFLASARIPDDSTRAMLSAMGDPPMLLKPGAAISLNVGIDGPTRQPIIDILTAKLKSNGVRVVPDQPVSLRVRVGETTTQVRARYTNDLAKETQLTGIPCSVTSVDLMINETRVWSGGFRQHVPDVIELKPDQPIAEAIPMVPPSPNDFAAVHLPRLVTRSPDALGMLQWSFKGLKLYPPQPSWGP